MKPCTTPLNVTIQKPQKRYVLAQPLVPEAIDMPPELAERVLATEQLVLRMPEGNAAEVKHTIQYLDRMTPQEQAKQVPISPLWHGLGEMSVERCHASEQGIPWRLDLERAVLDRRREAILQSLEQTSASTFIDELLTISAQVKGLSSTSFRTNGVRLAGDKIGWSWQFPSPQGISACLDSLHAVLRQRKFGNALVEAIVAYVILNWLHPFGDGNGRTSRVVFNAILQRAGTPQNHYIPIKEINYLARGGHEVRLRYTVATGNWTELLEYFVNVVKLYKELHQHKELARLSEH